MFSKFPAVWMAAAMAAGACFSSFVVLPLWVLIAIVLIALLVIFRLRHHNRERSSLATLLALLCVVSFGHHQIRYTNPPADHLSRVIQYDRSTTIFGKVADWPSVKKYYTEFTIAVDSLGTMRCESVSGGRLLLRISDTTSAIQRGDQVIFTSRVSQPTRYGSFDYAAFLKRRDLHGIVFLSTPHSLKLAPRSEQGWFALVDRLRASIVSAINECLTSSAAPIARGFLLGDTRDISTETYRLFQDTGTLHVLAVSGSNVALVLLCVAGLLHLVPLTRFVRSFILLGAIVLFSAIAFGEPSVIRASIMAALIVIARLIGRRIDFNNIIGAAALIILSLDPGQLFDVGFQLSFTVAWGLIVATPLLIEQLGQQVGYGWKAAVVTTFVASTVAQLVSMPLTYYYFDAIPLISFLANLVVVPLVSIVTVSTLLVLGIYLIWPGLAVLIGWGVSFIFDLLTTCLIWMYQAGGAPISLPGSLAESQKLVVVFLWLSLLTAALFALRSKLARRLLIGLTALSASFLLLCWWQQESSSDLVLAARHPGGQLCAIAAAGQPTQLVINGAISRRATIARSLFIPILNEWSIQYDRRWTVLQSDALTFRSLLAESEQLSLDTLFVAEPYFALATQEQLQSKQQSKTVIVPLLAGRQEFPSADAAEQATVMQFRTTWGSVLVTPLLTSCLVSRLDTTGCTILLVQVYPADDSLDLTGIEAVVCSEIAQDESEREAAVSSSAALINLAEIGTIRIVQTGDGRVMLPSGRLLWHESSAGR